MQNAFTRAYQAARQHHRENWALLNPSDRTAAIYHQMCRADSGCTRTGIETDRQLPPCVASDAFIARRRCQVAPALNAA